ncbi:MAG: thymidine phosphorylase [Kiritimatiellae bacterium]|nr:thymidine phosphorylase [Kiritimatiellia bacterium]
MLPQWIIEKKRDGRALSEDELVFFINGYTRGEIPDYQMAALAMAVFFRGMTPRETAILTRAMIATGSTLDTTSIPAPKVDKHSTGGIGDKISLILAPLVACCGAAVPMLSGRGLGITGGTLDKLESIPGYRTDLPEPEFLRIVAACGCSIMGQTATLAPADRKLYALRDVTGTVPSIPLITASIMSKKLAEGLDALVLDVKWGKGAFMKTREQARTLAQSMVRLGGELGTPVSALVTDMNQPLGRTAGNALEVLEAVETLQGRGPADVVELTLCLAARMLVLSDLAREEGDARMRLSRALESGAAFSRFKDMVRRHGGETACLEDPAELLTARIREEVRAREAGTIVEVDAEKIGRACVVLGAGRRRTEDSVDPAVGVSHMKKVGETTAAEEPLAVIHANRAEACKEAMPLVAAAYRLAPSRPAGAAAALITETV